MRARGRAFWEDCSDHIEWRQQVVVVPLDDIMEYPCYLQRLDSMHLHHTRERLSQHTWISTCSSIQTPTHHDHPRPSPITLRVIARTFLYHQPGMERFKWGIRICVFRTIFKCHSIYSFAVGIVGLMLIIVLWWKGGEIV